MNPHKNLAYGTVATAPSPATSGTSLVLTAGHGARMPAQPFKATIYPTGATPDPSNAEIVTVTLVSTDTLTIIRAREGTVARTVVVGDQLAASITEKDLDEPTVKGTPVEDVYVASDDTLLVGDELDLATNNVELVVDGEVICV